MSTLQELQFVGPVPTVLSMCGFHIRATKPPWLSSEYDCLVSIKHIDEEPGTTVLVPMLLDDDEGFDSLWGQLMKSCEPMMEKLNILFMTGFLMRGHDEPYIEVVRSAKESAIMAQRFDEAADLRDIERKLQRDDRQADQ